MKKTEAIRWHVRNAKNEYPIKIRTWEGKYKYYNTNLSVEFKKYFDDTKGLVKENHPDHVRMNTIIKNILKEHTVERSSMDSFKNYAKKHYESLYAAGRTGNAKKFQVMWNKLNKWHPADIKFVDLSPAFLKDFHQYMQSTGLNPNSIQVNLNKLKRVYNLARLEKLVVGENIFTQFKYFGVVTESKAMTTDEFEYFKAYDLADDKLNHYKDDALMLFYANGTRIGDALQWKFSNIKNRHIEYKMRKTSRVMKIKISEDFLDILLKRLPTEFNMVFKKRDFLVRNVNRENTDKYNFLELYALENPDKYLFGYLDGFKGNERQMYNKVQSCTASFNNRLKRVCKRMQVPVVSSHVMRHTFATRFLEVSGDIRAISSLLGHSSLGMTIKYIKTLGLEIVNDKSDEFYEKIRNNRRI